MDDHLGYPQKAVVDSTLWLESKQYRAVLTLITLGTMILLALSILCFAAFKLRAESFEFSTAILKIVSFSVKIRSPETADKRPAPRDRET